MGCEGNTCGQKKSCCGGSCGGSSGSKCGSKGEGTGCDMTDKILRLSAQAWEQLLLQKMKAEIEKLHGESVQKVAVAGVAAGHAQWEHKMAGKMKCGENKEKIKQAFMG